MVIIREAMKSDLVGVAMLFEELTPIKSNIDQMTKIFTHMQNDASYKLLVAEQNGKLVGSTMSVLCYDLVGECKPFVVVKNVIVNSELRGQGIGTKLIQEIEAIGKENKANYIMFVSSTRREKVHKFYESIGYKPDIVQGFKKFL